MGNLLALLQLLGAALPLIHGSVLLVESAFPRAKAGAQKLDAAVGIVSAALPALGATVDQVNSLVAPIKGVIGAIVSAYNAGGGVPAAVEQPAPVG